MNRREAFHRMMIFAAGSPLLAQSANDDVNGPVNVHEFEAVAKRKLNKLAYDFIAGGVENELTLRANRQAYTHVALIPRVMVDVSTVDTSVELLGMKLDAPIIICAFRRQEPSHPQRRNRCGASRGSEQDSDLHGDGSREIAR
jgi:FMN-dependent dehydrogenase